MTQAKEERKATVHGDPPNPAGVQRKCTDVLLFLFFIAFLAGEVIVFAYGYENGNPQELVGARDRNGDLCGQGGRGDDLFFPLQGDWLFDDDVDMPTDILDTGICVNSCPEDEDLPSAVTLATWAADANEPLTGWYVCDDTLLANRSKIAARLGAWFGGDDFDETPSCWIPYPTKAVFWRCFPYIFGNDTLSVQFYNPTSQDYEDAGYPDEMTDLLDSTDAAQTWVKEIEDKWPVFFWCAIIAVGTGFLFLFLVRMFAFLMVWFVVIITPLALILLTIFCWLKAGNLESDQVPGLDSALPDEYEGDISASKTNKQIFEAFGVIFTVASVVLVLLIIFMIPRINMAIKVMKMASRAVVALPSMLMLPIGSIIFDGMFVAWWIYTCFWIYSCGTYNKDTDEWEFNENVKDALIYHLIFLFWVIAFIDAIVQMSIAIAVSCWYFLRGTPEEPNYPVAFGLRTTLRYHIGTCAFGSLILAIVQTIRAIFNYMMSRLEGAKDNKVIKLIWYCVDYCLRCFERFIRFVNKSAYVQTAIFGTNFCVSLKNGVSLLLQNAARCAAMQYAGFFILFLGKMLIAMVATAASMYIFTYGEVTGTSTDSGVNPLALVIFLVIGWAVGVLFMSVFEMAMDTVFQCYCLDEGKANKELKEYFEEQDRDHENSKEAAANKA
eukprot:TRINITY_DN11446_c0_g1::TRINITY_DN11446_c0_g1_i1::g.10828::m.10828 TRINITY_DN11446_c0_g1::TRINITY_DN11446_c0_g1_i1::g.10828  ORF type:complete len:666 (-),score=255.96,sp/Q6IP59/CTL2_XENLA/27.91/1e-61,Choline_transpo/PF04515.7/2.2e+02,Choline_transpo/PF04515.7/4.3e+03,Choline_transpo/PF04515.7/1.7e-80 TRINITY_DN11446_c0_g1_i1:566-2563(-)